jgi:hypothetical protein
MGRACIIQGGEEECMGKSEGKRPLRITRRRSEDNIKMDLRVIEWGGMNWIHLAQDRN